MTFAEFLSVFGKLVSILLAGGILSRIYNSWIVKNYVNHHWKVR